MLFSCSIRDNIAYGADDPKAVTTEEIYTAAREANAYNFVKSFPQGFDTVVGEKGVLLSGQNELHTQTLALLEFISVLFPLNLETCLSLISYIFLIFCYSL